MRCVAGWGLATSTREQFEVRRVWRDRREESCAAEARADAQLVQEEQRRTTASISQASRARQQKLIQAGAVTGRLRWLLSGPMPFRSALLQSTGPTVLR